MNVVIERLILYNFFFVPAANKFFVWIIKNSVQELTISNFGPSIVFLGEQYTKLFMPKTITQTALRLAYSFFYGKSHRVQCRHKKKRNKFMAVSILMPFMSSKARKMHTKQQWLHTTAMRHSKQSHFIWWIYAHSITSPPLPPNKLPPWVIFEMNKWQTFQANAKWYWLVVLYLIIVWHRRPCYDFQTCVFRVSAAEDVTSARSKCYSSREKEAKKNGMQMKGKSRKKPFLIRRRKIEGAKYMR